MAAKGSAPRRLSLHLISKPNSPPLTFYLKDYLYGVLNPWSNFSLTDVVSINILETQTRGGDMERAKPSKEATVRSLIAVTPTQLRELANLLELSSQRAGTNDTAQVDLTEKISLCFTPNEKTLAESMREKADAQRNQQAMGAKPIPTFNS